MNAYSGTTSARHMVVGRQPERLNRENQAFHQAVLTSSFQSRCCIAQHIRPRTGSATVRLLVVDDHSVVRGGVTSWFQAQRGFEVVGEAETSREAVAQAILLKPDVVLLDVVLGDEGGLSAADQIVRSCLATRVVAFSASSDPVHLRGMFAAGARAYVLKTSELTTLLSAIESVLAGSKFLDPGLSDAVIEELDSFIEPKRRARAILTNRETQVLKYIVWGFTSKEIATELRIKTASVSTYRIRLREKLNLESRTEIVRYGIAVGLMKTCPPSKRPTGATLEDRSMAFEVEARRS
jgi:DNA-binding NarL/FixJ family response regulator